jgi:hypothetical protein
MKKGIIDCVRFYSTGIGLIYLIYVIFGQSKNQALAPFHVAIIILYFCSIFWMLSSIYGYFTKNLKTSHQKTLILLNFFVIFSFTLWMYTLN